MNFVSPGNVVSPGTVADDPVDLTLVREASQPALGEHQLAVHLHLEDAVFALDEPGPGPEFPLQFGRQPGGPRLVISNHAVFNRYVHVYLRAPETVSYPFFSCASQAREKKTGGLEPTKRVQARRNASIIPGPPISPGAVARVARCGAQRCFGPEGRGGVLYSTSSTPRRESAAGCSASSAAAGNW